MFRILHRKLIKTASYFNVLINVIKFLFCKQKSKIKIFWYFHDYKKRCKGRENAFHRIPLKESSWPGKQQRLGIIPLVFFNESMRKWKSLAEDLSHEYALEIVYQKKGDRKSLSKRFGFSSKECRRIMISKYFFFWFRYKIIGWTCNVRVSGLAGKLSEPSSYSGWVSYIHFHTNTFAKGMNPTFFLQLWVK